MLNVLQFHGPESRAANDAEESPFRFVAYSIDELKAAIRDTVAAVDSTVRVVSVNRDRLLPLLEELKVSTTARCVAIVLGGDRNSAVYPAKMATTSTRRWAPYAGNSL
jgi:hypothetical protein